MKELFKNSTTYTQDIYIEFLKFHNKTHNFAYTLYTIAWSAFFILCIYIAFDSELRLQGVLFTIILIAFIVYRLYHPKMVVDMEVKSDKISTNNTNTFTFFDKNFEVKNNNGSFIYRYIMLRKVFETRDYFYLYVTKENAFLISKKTFSLGSSEDFSKFISSKCKFRFRRKF